MFQFPGFPSVHYLFMCGYRRITNGEFPHSDICGSMLICSSPQLFAACHVLLRRLVPRHPPYALLRLIVSSFLSLSIFLLRTSWKICFWFFPQQNIILWILCITLWYFFVCLRLFLLWKNYMQLSRYEFLPLTAEICSYTYKEQKEKGIKLVVLHLYSRHYPLE